MGYALMPTFVGLQAPCNSFSGKIDPRQAASQGTAAANQAVTAAKSYGLGAGSAVTDLQSNTTVAGHSLAEPQAIWFALWDNGSSMTGSPYMTSAVWPVASRSKQYAGNRVVKVGGISLNIDADWVASAVARK